MKRLLFTFLLALALSFPALCEGLEPETAPEEITEFDLTAEDEPAPTPAPTAEQTPLPTLEPGSANYPSDKVNFEDEIWSILTRRWGLRDFQAAGLMSSLYLESSFSPYNAQSKKGVDDRRRYTFRTGDGVGFGLGQWTTPARKRALQRYAIAHGDANLVWDFDIQMGFMREDINYSALKATETLYEATEWAVMRFERPNQAYENSWPGSRYVIARQLYESHAKQAYAEAEPIFEIAGAGGSDLSEGFAFDGSAEISLTSNYYWRVDLPWWLEAQAPSYYDPDTWEARACGYCGQTPLRLNAKFPPLFRNETLRFNVYCGDFQFKYVLLSYTGKTLPETVGEIIGFGMKLADLF